MRARGRLRGAASGAAGTVRTPPEREGRDVYVYVDNDEEGHAPKDAARLARELRHAAPGLEPVLLGSIATDKYLGPLLRVFGAGLHFPAAFVGRGDMSRGGLLLRCVDEGRELEYVPAQGAERTGDRPPRLEPR